MIPSFSARGKNPGWRWHAAGLVGLTAALISAVPAAAQADVLANARDTLLQNGMRVIVAPNSSVPIATVEIAFRGGAQTQIEEEDEGIPHILEHMLFKSYERGGRDWWSEKTSDLDATYNGTTSDELVTYYLTLPSENVERGLELLGDLVRSTKFEQSALRDELQVVRGELERGSSDPYQSAAVVADMALWGEAYRQRNAIGNLFTILAAQADRLERHYERYYVPNNAALIVTGDIEPTEVFHQAAEHFSRWEPAPDPFEGLPAPNVRPLSVDSIFVVEADASDVTFLIRWLGPAAETDPDGATSGQLFSEIVNMPTSGAQNRLVDSGLFTGVSFFVPRMRGVTSISLVARTTPERIGAAADALRLELERWTRDGYFSATDVDAARKRLNVGAQLGGQTSAGLAHALAREWGRGGLETGLELWNEGTTGTAAGIRRFVERYLDESPRVICLVMSGETLNAQMDALVDAIPRWRRP